jgi:hypothetical protein
LRNMLTGDNPARAGEDSYGKSEAIMTPPKGIGPLLKQRLWLYFCSRVMFLVTVLVMNTAKKRQKLTDMQNYVLPYLQSFCSLEEKGVKERREQQIEERNKERADERGTSTETNVVVKDAGKADRKLEQQKQAMEGKEKKPSIHERLEINKRIIQEKQGKDKPERGADRGVR